MRLRKYMAWMLLLAFAALIPSEAFAVADMQKYCVQPPYVKRDIEPNILIIMDNSEINQGHAYKGNTIDPTSGLEWYNMNLESAEYAGLFHSKIWYSYDGTQFVPDLNGAYEGNMLNWAATSMYDLIQVVLLGGKSNSRQTNVNRLIGLNSGDWVRKVYVYREEVTNTYNACEIRVNELNKGELVITDNFTWVSSYGIYCGIIRPGAKRPNSAWRFISNASDYIPDAALYASAAPVRGGMEAAVGSLEQGPMARAFFSALNAIFSSLATEAEAKPVGIVNPNDGAILPDANLNSAYSDYQVSLSSGYTLDNVKYKWTVTGLPTGMGFANVIPAAPYNQPERAQAIIINGTPSSSAQAGIKHTITITVIEYYMKTPPTVFSDSTATITVYLTLNNRQLQIKYPPNGQPMTDAVRNQSYGYSSIATGGAGGYSWSATGLPGGLSINNGTGYISGYLGVSAGLYNGITITVSDGLTNATSNTSINVLNSDLRIISPLSLAYMPEGTVGQPYKYPLLAAGGSGNYTWSLYHPSFRPPGLSVVNTAGVWTLEGTPTAPWDNYVYINVYDREYVYTYPKLKVMSGGVEITWPTSDNQILAYMTCGQTYTGLTQMNATGGSGSYTWSSSNLDSLLPGMKLDASTGVISNSVDCSRLTFLGSAPYEYAYGKVTVSVLDNLTGLTTARPAYIVVYKDPREPVTYSTTAPTAIIGKEYGGFIPANYYSAGQSTWILSPSTPLPAGLFINPSTGLISGVLNPAVPPGTYALDLKLTSPSGMTRLLSQPLVVSTYPPVRFTSSSYSVYAKAGENIIINAVAKDGMTPYTFSATLLPTGMTAFSNGVISGAITNAGSYTANWTVKDSFGDTHTVPVNFYINPVDALSIAYPASGEVFKTAETVNVSIATFAATGGVGPYTWSATGLPSGLTISSRGLIFGTPATGTSTSSPYNVTITVKDNKGTTVTRSVQIEVASALSLTMQSLEFNIQVCASATPTVAAPSLPYTQNCKTAGTAEYKSGLLQDYWDQARFGLMDFDGKMSPNVTICPPANNASSFYTAVENATPVGITNLVDGMYRAEQAYRGDLPASVGSSCDPFTASGADPVPPLCTNNYILVLTSGEGANNPPEINAGNPLVYGTNEGSSSPLASPWTAPPFPAAECTEATNNMSKNSCYGWEVDIRTDKEGTQKVSTYVVNAMGSNLSHNEILKQVADVSNGNYYYADRPAELKDKIKQAFKDILKRAASGTAASVLASGAGRGANMIQAVYYPARKFRNSATGVTEEIGWLGRLSNFWFYVDPRHSYSGIHEETGGNSTFTLSEDYIVELYYDTITDVVRAARYLDADGDSVPDTGISIPGPDGMDIEFEFVGNIWEAGLSLWNRDLAAEPRKIYTNLTNTPGAAMVQFNVASAANAALQQDLQAADSLEASTIIRYVNGEDITGYRSRTVTVDINGDGDTNDIVRINAHGLVTDEGTPRVWKLGDILNSTPRIASHLAINDYYTIYGQSSYRDYTALNKTAKKGMVFSSSNDGMLHAFKLGYLDQENITSPVIANLTSGATPDPIGKEMWAFIPKNALPYLRYQMEPGYCHLYTVDQTPYLVDTSIARPTGCTAATEAECDLAASSWRTILIGGMRFGGGCKPSTATCNSTNSTDTNLDGVVDDDDCIKTPLPSNGFSSYFALDITEENNPQFMWEFTHAQLGASSSGPAVVRIPFPKADGSGPEYLKGGYWFVVFGSGPTGTTNYHTGSTNHGYQYMGNSDQNLRLFILNLKTGALLRTIDTGLSYAFAGSMIDSTVDYQLHDNYFDRRDFADDALYLGYTNKCTVAGVSPVPCTLNEWNDGGVIRLMTEQKPNPNDWEWSYLAKHIGPVTAAVATMNDGDDIWLYIGTGRYNFMVNAEEIVTGSAINPTTGLRYPDKDAVADDPHLRRHLIGVKEPCFTDHYVFGCTAEVDYSAVNDVTDVINVVTNSDSVSGWVIELDPVDSVNNLFSEREITDPVASPSTGMVLFTTFKPYADKCSYGGNSHVWGVTYDDGGAPGAAAKGVALIQVSTGAIEKMDLSKAFDNEVSRGGRRSVAIEGIPPLAKGLGLSAPPDAVNRVLHIFESDK